MTVTLVTGAAPHKVDWNAIKSLFCIQIGSYFLQIHTKVLFKMEFICIWPHISLLVATPPRSNMQVLKRKITQYSIMPRFYFNLFNQEARAFPTSSGASSIG